MRQACPDCQVTRLTPADRMLVVSVDSDPLLITHCGHYQLVVSASQVNIGQVEVQFVTGTWKFSQSLPVQESFVEQAAYNNQSNLLATLHANWTVAVTKLDLDLANRLCRSQVLTIVSVPYGLKLSNIWFNGTQVLLYQDKSVRYPDRKVDRAQLVLVDTQTGCLRNLYAPVRSLGSVFKFGNPIFIKAIRQSILTLYQVSLNQDEKNY